MADKWGSHWAKWDLHVHPPGTMKADRWNRMSIPDYVAMLASSGCKVIGVTDYFSVEKACEIRRYVKENKCDLMVLPNLELRDPRIIAKSNLNYHVIFSEEVTEERLKAALARVDVTIAGGKKPLTELSRSEIKTATVPIGEVVKALGAILDRATEFIIVLATGNDGYRPINTDSPSPMAMAQSEEVVGFADGFFGNEKSRAHWLKPDNYDKKQRPVFSCSDAHGEDRFTEFHSSDKQMWIRAMPGFRGLLECLIEPESRICFRSTEPEPKDPSKVISRILVSSSKAPVLFDQEICFNPGINSIIGSRSSGKSVLLSSISYNVNPSYTIAQQKIAAPLRAGRKSAEKEYGPANSWTWESAVKDYRLEVHWKNGEVSTFDDPKGKLVYIPQGYLNNLAENDESIDQLIRDVLKSIPSRDKTFSRLIREQALIRQKLESCVVELFDTFDNLSRTWEELLACGSEEDLSVQKRRLMVARDGVAGRNLSKEDEDVKELEAERRSLLEALKDQTSSDADFDSWANLAESIGVPQIPGPASRYIQSGVEARWNRLIAEFVTSVRSDFETYWAAVGLCDDINRKRLVDIENVIKRAYGGRLPEEMSAEMAELEGEISKINQELQRLSALKSSEQEYSSTAIDLLAEICKTRDEFLNSLEAEVARWNSQIPSVNQVFLKLEVGHEKTIDEVVDGFALRGQDRDWSALVRENTDLRVRDWGWESLAKLYVGAIRLNSGVNRDEVARRLASDLPSVRPVAYFDNDRIGGFEPTSMSAGKRALVGLEFILGMSGSNWPLLIDQPEDDLDSRSIFDSVVPYLRRARTSRQILMVTHDANLVVATDSELVVVCNRNSAEFPNPGDRQFWYASGAFEDVLVWPKLPSGERKRWYGSRIPIVDHVCTLLDGGAEAFEKRAYRYPN